MMLHRSIIVGSLLVFSVPAIAQTVETPPLSVTVPMPREESGVSGYRILAIAAGAVVGVIVVNALTGGLITPILMAGSGGVAMPAMAAVAAEPIVAAGAGAAAVEAAAAAPVAAAAAPAAVEVAAAAPAVVAAAPAAAGTVAATTVAGASYAYMAVQTGVVLVGATVGGYIGNWLYGGE